MPKQQKEKSKPSAIQNAKHKSRQVKNKNAPSSPDSTNNSPDDFE